MAMEQKEPKHEGWIKKKSPKGFFGKPWQKRYFILQDDLLFYYKEKPSREDASNGPAGTIPLEIIESIEAQADKKPAGCRFDIKLVGGDSGSRVFELCTDEKEDCEKWINILNELRATAVSNGGHAMEADGKVWKKDPDKIREARARSSIAFGNQRYLIQADPGVKDSDEEETSLQDEDKSSIYDETGATSLELVKELEKDHFGQIHSVRDKRTKALYLMHVFLKNNPSLQEAVKLFDAMAKLKHPYLFQQIHRGQTSDAIVAVYSYALEQSLFVHLRKARRFPEEVVQVLAAELVLVLAYLHESNLPFRNMRAENVFLDSDGHAVVSDFLIALPPHLNPKTNDTPEYHTPEKLKGSEDDSLLGDWWRLGVLMYELLVGIPPFRHQRGGDENSLRDRILAHGTDPLPFPPFVSEQAQQIILLLLTPDPSTRLGAQGAVEVMKQPFFATVNWARLQERRVQSPDWVDETLMSGRRSAAGMKRSLDPTKQFKVEVAVMEARGLPGLRADGHMSDPFCTIRLEGNDPFDTDVVENTVTPVWAKAKTTFNVTGSLSDHIEVAIFHKEAGTNSLIGTVKYGLSKARAQREGDTWLPIVGRDGMAHGEVRISFSWLESAERQQLLPPTDTNTTFKHFFGGEKAQDIMNQDNDVFSDL